MKKKPAKKVSKDTIEKMFSRASAKLESAPKKRAKKATKKRKVGKSPALAAPYGKRKKRTRRRKLTSAGKPGRIASVTQTKQGMLIKFYKPKQLHFRFPKI